MYSREVFYFLSESLCRLGYEKCEVQFSQCEGQLSQFYLQVLLLLAVLLSVLDLLCMLSGQFCFGSCTNSIQAIGSFGFLLSRSGGISFFCAWLSL